MPSLVHPPPAQPSPSKTVGPPPGFNARNNNNNNHNNNNHNNNNNNSKESREKGRRLSYAAVTASLRPSAAPVSNNNNIDNNNNNNTNVNNVNTKYAGIIDTAFLSPASSFSTSANINVTPTTTTTATTATSKKGPLCHGRVKDDDFEKMVPAQWWKTVFGDDLYLKTDGDVVEDPEITREEIRMLEANPHVKNVFQRESTILDLCCGQGRHSIMLAEKYPNMQIFGHDQSSYLINVANSRTTSLQTDLPKPRFSVGDCRHVPFDDAIFDLVMVMGNSFGYFGARDIDSEATERPASPGVEAGDEGDRMVLKEIQRITKPGACLVLDLVDGEYMRDNFSPRSWEWIDDSTFVCRERALSKDGKRLYSREVVVAADRGVVRDQFYSERLYSKVELGDILKKYGFELDENQDTHMKEGLTVTAAKELSQRGQDLGMMEQRLLIFATKTHGVRQHVTVQDVDKTSSLLFSNTQDCFKIYATPDTYHLRPFPPKFPNSHVAVVMGDTSIPCREKLNGTWNKEDFDTRQRLFKALLDCGYNQKDIKVYESHKTFLNDIQKNSPAFVFNLCDEGFQNDANKELHVPAALEMCGIAYSGSGPVGLGVCYDKGLVNATAAKIGVNTPRETHIIFPESISPAEISTDLILSIVAEKEAAHELTYPAFVKPMKGDNSLGITENSICYSRDALASYIASLITQYSMKEFIIQEYLTGTEYSVGMIGNPETGFFFLPILQVDYSKVVHQHGLKPILGWESKWDPQSPYWTEIDYVPAERLADNTANLIAGSKKVGSVKTGGLTPVEESILKNACIKLFERFGCRDYARFDWRADREIFRDASENIWIDQPSSSSSPSSSMSYASAAATTSTRVDISSLRTIKLLEVNPNPGWCWDGKLAKMAHFVGLEYHDMIKSVLWASWERHYGRIQPPKQRVNVPVATTKLAKTPVQRPQDAPVTASQTKKGTHGEKEMRKLSRNRDGVKVQSPASPYRANTVEQVAK